MEDLGLARPMYTAENVQPFLKYDWRAANLGAISRAPLLHSTGSGPTLEAALVLS